MAEPKYVSLSDFNDILPESQQAELTDDYTAESPNVGDEYYVKDDAMLKRYLCRAESRVEAYLTGYTLPLDPAPPLIEWCVLVFATHMLFQRSDAEVSEQVRESYNEIRDFLIKIQQGDAQLPEIDEDDDDFVGFGDTSSMTWDEYPHRDYILQNW